MSSPIQSQRATTWLCLVLALFIAVLPASGLMLCLGHDGHVSLAAGSSSQLLGSAACPCEHDEQEPQAVLSSRNAADVLAQADDDHAPCDDFDLDAPEAVRSSGFSQDLPTLLGTGIEQWTASLHLQTQIPAALEALVLGSLVDSWDPGASAFPHRTLAQLPLAQLAHRRSIVLLI